MQRIASIDPTTATGAAKEILDGVKKQLGMVPNLFKVFAQSPAVLKGHLANVGALSEGVLSAGLREQIALTVAGTNACDYCASAHTALGKMAGVKADELASNLEGRSADAKTQAALTFAKKVVEARGHLADADIAAVRAAGYGEAEIVEIIAHVASNIFTNYTNQIAATAIDFPLVKTAGVKAAA